MKAENIEQIREHLARGGRVMCHRVHIEGYEPEVYEVYGASSKDGNGIVVNYIDQMWLNFNHSSVDHWELLPIENETEEERQAWIEKAERDFPVDFEKTWHRKQVDSALPKIHIGNTNMTPEQQQLYYAALRIASDLKYLKDQLTEKEVEDNPRLIMLALDSISIRAEALQDALARNNR